MDTSMTPPNSIWRVVGASVAGTSHRRIGRGCDDSYAYRRQGKSTLLMAVADGAGSAAQSAEGAARAVQAALDAAEVTLAQQAEPTHEEQWHGILSTVLKAVRFTLEELASGRATSFDRVAGEMELTQQSPLVPLREFATTLLLTIVTMRWVTVAQIGDGAVVVQHMDGMLQTVTQPGHGEYINETNFVTDPDYLKWAKYAVLPRMGIHGIALLTDGLQMLALDFPKNTPYKPFFTPLFRFAGDHDGTEEELVAFLDSERICARTDDDKTLVLAVCL